MSRELGQVRKLILNDASLNLELFFGERVPSMLEVLEVGLCFKKSITD